MKKHKNNPLFKGFPKHLKDPKNYKKTEETIAAVMKTDHTHKTVASYVRCKECQVNREKKNQLMKAIGFKSYPQYLEWRRVMDIMINQFNVKV
jgi:hypothetical protein